MPPSMDFDYVNYATPNPNDYRALAHTLGDLKNPGEYRISPVDNQTFHAWAESHKDYPHRLHRRKYNVSASCSNIIIQQILRRVDAINGTEVNLSIGTGLTKLKNNVQKNSDQGISSHESGTATYYPGIVVETGFSDTQKKARRDIILWLENSDMNVKLGISCKIAVDSQKNITQLIFEFYEHDINQWSGTNPMGCACLVKTLDFSGYDGRDVTAPPVTSYSIPSYCIFSDGVYPGNYLLHSNPPSPITVAGIHLRQLTAQKANILAVHVNLVNTQRAPLVIDFRRIADLIRQVKWDV